MKHSAFYRFSIVIITLVVAMACGARAISETDDASAGIQKFVAGEDNDFHDLQGDRTNTTDSQTWYKSSLQLPGATACAVYVVNKDKHHFATCDFDAATQDDAANLSNTWFTNLKTALPGWKVLDVKPLPEGDLAAKLFTDAGGTHGVYIHITQSSDGKHYVLTTTFGTMAALQSS